MPTIPQMTFSPVTDLPNFLKAVASHAEPYTVKMEGFDIIVVPPHVMSPAHDFASHHFAAVLQQYDLNHKSVLDVGTGTGVLAVMAWERGAESICALDINPHAVQNARQNFDKHKVAGRVFESDLFNELDSDEKFDVIMFEAPYFSAGANSFLELAVADKAHQTSARFFSEVGQHLKDGGIILYGFSPSFGDYELVMSIACSTGYSVTRMFDQQCYEKLWRVTELKQAHAR